MEMTVAEQLLYTTLRLSTFKNGNPVGHGTGFFWRFAEGKRLEHLIVTNKHVIDGCDTVVATCHIRNSGENAPSGIFVNLAMELAPEGVFYHPDPKIDLCALAFNSVLEATHKNGAPIFLRALVADNVPTSDQWASFDAIEDVLMLGCPNGIYDEENNHPIVRRGITATSMGKDYNGAPEFLVDMACFPGSSGSPVVVKQNGYFDRTSGSFAIGAGRFFFVGVLYAGPTILNSGSIVLGAEPSVTVAATMHLGQIIRSSKVLDIEALVRAKVTSSAILP